MFYTVIAVHQDSKELYLDVCLDHTPWYKRIVNSLKLLIRTFGGVLYYIFGSPASFVKLTWEEKEAKRVAEFLSEKYA